VQLCPQCSREDFAGGIRCQWCGTHFASSGLSIGQGGAATATLTAGQASPFVDTTQPFTATALAQPSQGTAPTAPVDYETPAEKEKSFFKKIGAFFLPAFYLLLKAKSLLVFLKFGKLLTMGGSMLVSMWLYAQVFGWAFAIGLVVLIFVHEMGHVFVIWRKGLPASAPIFIPFLGAAIFLRERPQDPLTDAQISYGGPALGSVGAFVCFLVYLQTKNPLWLVYAHLGFFLNLFNLAPAVPLDGGWIVRAISPRLWLAGAAISLVIGFVIHSVMLIIIAGLSVLRAWSAVHNVDDDEEQEKMEPKARIVVTGLYLGLAVLLGTFLGYSTHVLDALRTQGLTTGIGG
jgi:Zn-dependent protease